jgi:O-acetyl-ADP-ribose deacetylase (regulator of RNase III)
MKPNPLDKITLFQGDITTLDVDVIVNAANTSLLGGGGVDGAIHRTAGPGLLAECQTLNGCPTGEAKLTRAYNLPSRYVIHTVGPVYRGRSSDRHLLQSCYEKSFQLAIDTHLESIAFPAISCGIYGYPIAEAAAIAIDTTIRYMNYSEQLKLVTFVLFSRAAFDIYLKLLKDRTDKGSTHLQ